ncbi:MAG: 16S rRNA processing protein RimM [Fusobacteria bacterium]|nr:MAG: 16S rRNA processing protein RimM [Fusobacteriota bacterium]KAF0229860.1 MAG: 16S rRNA processing protein [Fusobacteriota bacterium]
MIKLGKIVGTFGIKGELKIYPLTNYKEMFLEFEDLLISTGKDLVRVNVVKARIQKNTIIILLEGIDSINKAQDFIGKDILIEESLLPELDETEEYVYKLLGMKVFLENSELLGSISDVFDNGAHGIYEIKDENGKEILIPVLEDTIISRDFDEGIMVVKLLPGLLD